MFLWYPYTERCFVRWRPGQEPGFSILLIWTAGLWYSAGPVPGDGLGIPETHGRSFWPAAVSGATGGGARVSVGIPETGAPVELEWTEYTAVVEGSSHDRGRLLSYEVESREVHACGERTAFQGRELTICGRTCESRKGELIFTCRLARPEWASQRRLSNEKLSGLSLLGTVLSGEEETLRLKLDIDRDHPDQNQGNEYPFPWRPATGNLMYHYKSINEGN